MLITKLDLLGKVPFDLKLCVERAWRVNPRLRGFPVSALVGSGMEAWYQTVITG
jgi:Ni2+-binding GTPase involved in maturation of urease and hydrogenase